MQVAVFKFISALTLMAATATAQTTLDCIDAPYDTTNTSISDDLSRLRKAIEPFPSLKDTLENGMPRLCWSTGPLEALGTFEVESQTITVSRDLPPGLRTAVLVHELRHFDQARRGICPDDTLAMRAFARQMFALEADAAAIAHLVAWQIFEDGDDSVFDALLTAEESRDIATAFKAEMQSSDDVGMATAKAFDAWYASPSRQERYYLSICGGYLDRLDETHLLPTEEPATLTLPPDLCRLPNNATYPCEEPEAPLPR